MILTRDEIDSMAEDGVFRSNIYEITCAVEQAILQKIGEPVAWQGHSGTLAYSKTSLMPGTRHLAIPLYKIPESK